MKEYGRGKGGGPEGGKRWGTLVPGSGGPSVELRLGRGMAFQTVLLLVAEKHVIWGSWACWSSGELKGSIP